MMMIIVITIIIPFILYLTTQALETIQPLLAQKEVHTDREKCAVR